MKAIEQMTVEEMREEMRGYKTREAEKYIFVSYSHKDSEKVYPVVLKWMRRGYNVYIDLDFANHGSDENWVTMMCERIQDSDCVLVTAFRSKHAAFSYATLLELLTARSDETTMLHGGEIPVDIIEIEKVGEKLDLHAKDVNKEEYIAYFEELKSEMGAEFGEKNTKERTLMQEGLSSWYEQKEKKLTAYKNADAMMKMIDTGYKRGATNFFPFVARLAGDWLRTFDLNGNKKRLDDAMDERFANLELKASPVKAEVPTPKRENPVKEKKQEPKAKPAEKPAAAEPAARTEGNGCYFQRADKRTGWLKQTGEKEFVVLSGAEMRKDNTPTCPGQFLKLREEILSSGGAAEAGEGYVLTRDVTLTSMSAAAGILVGRSVNGKEFWQPCSAPELPAQLEKEAPAAAKTVRKPGPNLEFYERTDGRAGRVKAVDGKEFWILPGAEMRKDQAPSCQYTKLRQEILDSGAVKEQGEDYVFQRDYCVSSLSAAAAALSGRSVSGNVFWKEEVLPPLMTGIIANGIDVTIGTVRRLFAEDETFCRMVGDLRRNDLPWGGRGALDFAMAAILGGCNEVKSPAQINYYKFAIADMGNKKSDEGLGATWTWSSNCRKIIAGPKAGSGKIDAEVDAYFASLPEDTTLGTLRSEFTWGEGCFETQKNPLIVECLEKFMALV